MSTLQSEHLAVVVACWAGMTLLTAADVSRQAGPAAASMPVSNQYVQQLLQ